MLRIRALKGFFDKLFYVLTKEHKRLLIAIVIITSVNALLQMLGVSIIVPLVNAMMDMEGLMQKEWVAPLARLAGTERPIVIFVMICLGTILLYIFKNVFNIFSVWINVKYSKKVQRELSYAVLDGYMHREYDFFLSYGSMQVIRDVQSDTGGTQVLLQAFLNALTELLTMTFILIYIISMDRLMAICIFALALLCIVIIYAVFKRKLKEAGEKQREAYAVTNKILLHAIEGMKEVQVMRKQQYFADSYKKAYIKQQKPEVAISVETVVPTYVVEGIFVSGIMAFICIQMIIDPSYVKALPLLASFMFGAIRMLPSLGRISSNINIISSYMPSLWSVYNNIIILREEKKQYEEIKRREYKHTEEQASDHMTFRSELSLVNISYHYKGMEKNVLSELNLTIRKGQSVGIIGSSGAGKSTLVDIILGLHIPQSGELLLDGINIRDIPDAYSHVIGFVPQAIYLVDGTVRENVAFGEEKEKINDEKVWECLKRAHLAEFIRNTSDGIDTIVGERGVRFSGGQRQRIAIARALYREPQILVLDEATSALDNDTEADVMKSIEGLYGTITMIIIAHRLTTIKNCDVIYEIEAGRARLREKRNLFENESIFITENGGKG